MGFHGVRFGQCGIVDSIRITYDNCDGLIWNMHSPFSEFHSQESMVFRGMIWNMHSWNESDGRAANVNWGCDGFMVGL